MGSVKVHYCGYWAFRFLSLSCLQSLCITRSVFNTDERVMND